MKKIFALLICIFTLASCDSSLFEDMEYPVETYDVENSADGVYNVTWQNESGFPDLNVAIKITKGDDIIYDYICEYKGEVSLPEKIIYLFDYKGGKVYYVQNYMQNIQGKNVLVKPPFIAYNGDGANKPDCMNWEMRAYEKKETAEFLHENITEQEIKDLFSNAGYDDKYILQIYNYEKGVNEND